MGNMGSKLRKGRAAYQRSVAAKHAALRTQKSYISDYNRLLGMGPNKSNDFTKSLSVSTVMTSAGGRRRPSSYATGFAFRSSDPLHSDNNYRWRTHADNNRHHYSINYRPVSSYAGLLASYRDKAIGAELGGIAAAQAAISGIQPMDLSYIKSARGKSGSKSPKKNAAGFYISDGGTTGVTGTVSNFANKSYQDAGAYAKARQAAETKEGKAAIDAKWQSDVQSSYLSSFKLTLKSKAGTDAKKPTETKKVGYGWSPSTYDYLGVLPEEKKPSAETQKLAAQQQAMLDATPGTGLVMFGLDGRVSAAPKSGTIDWSQFEGMTEEKKKQVKYDIGNIMIERDIGTQLVEQDAAEKKLNEKIDSLTNSLMFEASVQNVSEDDKQNYLNTINKYDTRSEKEKIAAKAFNIYGNFANEDFTTDEQIKKQKVRKERQEKMQKMEGELNILNLEKKALGKKRSMIDNAISSVGRNDLFTRLYESGTFDAGTMSQFMTINTDQDRDRQVNMMSTMSQEQDVLEASISTLSKLERKIIQLKKSETNTRGKGDTVRDQWEKKRDTLYAEIEATLPGYNVVMDGTDASILKNVKTKIDTLSKTYSSEFKDIKLKKNKVALQIAKNSTNAQTTANADVTNATIKAKQSIEDMTGFDLTGQSLDNVMNAWTTTWIGGGAKGLMRGAESIDIITGGKLDQNIKNKLTADASVIRKYDAWDDAEKFIGGSISNYRTDLKNTYKKSYRNHIVPDSKVSKSWFGKSTVDGQSFTLTAANEIGVREGLGARDDVGKIVKKSETYRNEIKDHIQTKKHELVELRKQQQVLQESHKELLPLIDQQVEKSVNAGGQSINQTLVKKIDASSQKLYDLNYKIAEHQVAQKFYEKSLIKTESDIDDYKKYKKQLDFEVIQGTSSSGLINRIKKSGRYGRSQAKRFRRNTGRKKNTTRSGIKTETKSVFGDTPKLTSSSSQPTTYSTSSNRNAMTAQQARIRYRNRQKGGLGGLVT